MTNTKFSDDFKRDAVAQITGRGDPVKEVSERLGVSQHALHAWKKTFAQASSGEAGKDAETRRLKRELARVPQGLPVCLHTRRRRHVPVMNPEVRLLRFTGLRDGDADMDCIGGGRPVSPRAMAAFNAPRSAVRAQHWRGETIDEVASFCPATDRAHRKRTRAF